MHGADRNGVTILKNSGGGGMTGTGQGGGKGGMGDGGGGRSGSGGGVRVERLVPFVVGGGGLDVCTRVNTVYKCYVLTFYVYPRLPRACARTHTCIC